MEQNIKPGDFFLIQFGHNDQKLEYLQAKKGYQDNLIRYIREIREKEAYPGDYTHSNDYGGYLMGGFVAAEITRVCTNDSHYKMLADCVTAGFGPWKPCEKE